MARRKRATQKALRCKPRTKSSASPQPTSPSKPDSGNKADPPKKVDTPAHVSSSGGKKVGLAWANDNSISLGPFVNGNTKFAYTWSPWKVPGADKFGITSVPMLWGSKQEDEWYSMVKPGYSTHAMGMNEPNQSGQSDMSPGDAAALWGRAIAPLRNKGYTLVSPACTNAASGFTWMQDFFDKCGGTGCVDIIALHYYGTDPDDFIDHITKYHNQFGKKIWVTEFACQNFGGGGQCSDSDVRNFMAKTTSFMESVDWVDAYFWFGMLTNMGNVNPANQLMNGPNKLSSLGSQYLNA